MVRLTRSSRSSATLDVTPVWRSGWPPCPTTSLSRLRESSRWPDRREATFSVATDRERVSSVTRSSELQPFVVCGWPHLNGGRAAFPSSRAWSSLNPLHLTRGRIEMGANVSTVMVVVALATGLWWGFSRGRRPALLEWFSVVALALAVATLVVEGLRWQLVLWQVLALAVAAAAALRRWRPGHSRRWRRVAGRGVLIVGLTLGGLALLTAFVPALPKPSGPHRVGSVTFRWTDETRSE